MTRVGFLNAFGHLADWDERSSGIRVSSHDPQKIVEVAEPLPDESTIGAAAVEPVLDHLAEPTSFQDFGPGHPASRYPR